MCPLVIYDRNKIIPQGQGEDTLRIGLGGGQSHAAHPKGSWQGVAGGIGGPSFPVG